MKILIVKPSSLGDILHVFPALELLHRRYPEAEADWLVQPGFADLLNYSPLPVRRKILFHRHQLGKALSFPFAFLRLFRELRRERYDMVIDFQGLMRSAFFAWLARRSGPVIGFANPRESASCRFYGKKFEIPQKMHAVERNAGLVNALLGTADPVPDTVLPVGPKYQKYSGMAAGKTVIGLVPGARWVSKQFPAALFAGVIAELREKGPQDLVFWVIGSRNERDAEELIMDRAGNAAKDIVPLSGRTSMRGMVEALRCCSAVLCNDSGPMHAAAAVHVPVVALFGPTRPELTGPYGKGHWVLQAEDLRCLGCMDRYCRKGPQPACHRISAELAAQKILAILAERKSHEGESK